MGKAQNVRHTPLDVLAGVSPSLVITLAKLAGATQDDLLVTLQLAPFGDRAAMSAYGLIELVQVGENLRVSEVHDFCLEVISAAAELCASVASPARVAREIDRRREQDG